jgi:glycerophosphoryl diester phosphodiesterase
MRAFERARELGARAVELDVRTCASGDVVVFHDATLARMTGRRDARRVCDVPLEQLAGVDLGDGAGIPTLAGVLAWARLHGVGVNVEMKHDVPSRAVLARGTIREVRASCADVLLSSFDPWLLAMAAALSPSVPRALLTHAKQARWAGVLQTIARPPLVRALHLERVQADPRALARYARRGLRLGVWTVNDPREALELARRGVASIITDAPDVVLAGLTRT